MVTVALPGVHPPQAEPSRPAVRRADPGDPALLPPLVPATGGLHRPPWPGREITAGGVTLHVRETPGAGRRDGTDDAEIVYVHGLSGSATNWTDLAGLLAHRAPGLAVDLPGFGRSRPLPSCDYTPAGHADALMCFLAGRGRPVDLVGNSLGGMIAMLVTARRPELVRSLTLVSPAMPDFRPDIRRVSDPRQVLAMVPGIGARARAELAATTPRVRAERVVAACFGDPSRASEARLEEAAAEIAVRIGQPWANEAATRTTLGMFASWAGRGVWSAASRVRVPTLVVWGDRDRLVSPRLAERTVRTLPDARLLMLEGVGHIAQIEVPHQVAAAVLAFWDSLGPERAASATAWRSPQMGR